MCASQPALLVSVGYDCKINIFDIRRNRAQASTDRLTYSLPLSTVALSECGTYLCAGNLKGELIAYDMRTTKTPLAVKSVHDTAVTRVAFVPMPSGENQQNGSLNGLENATGLETETPRVERAPSDELRKSIAANLLSTQQQLDRMGFGAPASASVRRDSFCDFLDAQGPKAVDRMSTRLGTSYRDSFDWETLNRKPISNETAQRQSLCPPMGSNHSSVDNSGHSFTTESLQRKFLLRHYNAIFNSELILSFSETLSGPLKDRSNLSGEGKLMKIAETDEHCEEQSENISVASSTGAGSDKENPPPVDPELKRRLRLLSASRNSTPHHANVTPQSSNPQLKPQKLLAKSSSGLSAQMDADWRKEFSELRDFVDQRCGQVERELEYVSHCNQRQVVTQMATYMKQQMDNTVEIRDALALLLRGDSFMREFSRLQHENEMLRARLKFYQEQERTESSGE